MGLVILSAVILVVCLALVLIGVFGMPSQVERYRGGGTRTNYAKRIVIVVAALIGLILPAGIIWGAGNHSVPTKYVGVITSYGKVVGEKGPGHFWMWPTHSINLVSRTIQSDNFLQRNSDGNGNPLPDSYTNSGATGYCITVRLGMQNEGCADIQLQTETNAAAIPNLYANYSSYGPNLTQDVDRYVVKRDLTTVLNRDLGDYNVIQDITQQLESCDLKKIESCVVNAQSQFSKFDPQLTKDLQKVLGNQVTVQDINLQYIHYDANTEAAIQKITNNYLATAAAIQQQQTNTALSQAAANLQNNKQAITPQYLQYLCYQTTQDAEKTNYQLPATWNCSGGSGAGVLIKG
jgi:hypothetical protein